MFYLDHGTGRVTNDEDLAIALTGGDVITAEVDCAVAALVIEGVLEPLAFGEAA